jgi:hypothetical protein
MSDSDVIDGFVGDYESDGNTTNVTPGTRHYYPTKGVKLVLEKVELKGVDGGAYAKIRITDDGDDNEPFGAKLALGRAVFRVHGSKLIADNMELAPGTLLTETLEMTENSNGKKEMTHTLNFADGTLGTWICKT